MNKYIKIGKTIFNSLIYVFFGLAMIFVVRMCALHMSGDLISLVLEVIIGGLVYLGLCTLYWWISRKPYLSYLLKQHN